MPYRRRYAARKSSFKGRRGFGRPRVSNWGAAKQLAMSAYKGVKYLRGLVNSELYKVDVNTSLTFTSTPTVTLLTGIAQGDGDGARTGNSVLMKSLNCRFSCNAGTAANTFATVIIFMDMQQASDTNPTAADVLENSTNYASFLNSETVGRYKILQRKILNLNNIKSGSAYWQLSVIRPQGHHLRFNGANATDTQKGHIYALTLSDQAAGAAAPVLSMVSRLTYHDN